MRLFDTTTHPVLGFVVPCSRAAAGQMGVVVTMRMVISTSAAGGCEHRTMFEDVTTAQLVVGFGGTIASAAVVGYVAHGEPGPPASKRRPDISLSGWVLVIVSALLAPGSLRRVEAYGWSGIVAAALVMALMTFVLIAVNLRRRQSQRRVSAHAAVRGDTRPPRYAPIGVALSVTLAAVVTTWVGSAKVGLFATFASDPVETRVSKLVPWAWYLAVLAALTLVILAAIVAIAIKRRVWPPRAWWVAFLLSVALLAFGETLMGPRGSSAVENVRAMAFLGAALIAWAALTLLTPGPSPAWRRSLDDEARCSRKPDPTSIRRRELSGVTDDLVFVATEPALVRAVAGFVVLACAVGLFVIVA